MAGNNTNLRWAGIVVLLAIILPFVPGISDFDIFQFTMVLVYAIALLGLNLLTGYNGQFSLGHGAFYAVGAYVAAIMMDKWGAEYYMTIPVAALVCLVVGFLFGLPALRLEGHYLALATFALALAVPQMLKHKSIEYWTGGVQGIVIIKPDPPELLTKMGITLSQDQWLYLFTLLIVVILFVCAWNLLRGRTGRALIAIRDHHMAADTMGINTALYKSLTFGVSAMYTGIAGALGAIAIQFVAPDSFTILLSISLLVGVVIGGLASIPGALFGGAFIMYTPNIASNLSRWLPFEISPWTIYGIFLIVFMYLMPIGIWGGLRKLYVLALKRKSA